MSGEDPTFPKKGLKDIKQNQEFCLRQYLCDGYAYDIQIKVLAA